MIIRIRKREAYFFVLFTLLFLVMCEGGFLKYIVALLAALLCLYINKGINKTSLIVLIPPITLSIIGIISCIFNGYFSYFTIQEVILVLTPSVTSIGILSLMFRLKINPSYILFWAIAVVNYTLAFSFSTTDLAESQYAFIYGVFLLYFLYKKNWLYLGISIILFILANKRISLGAAILCFFIYVALTKMHRNQKKIIVFTSVVLMLFCVIYIYLIKYGMIDLLFARFSINTMGRLDAWKIFSNDYLFSLRFCGNGLGFVRNQLEMLNRSGFSSNLHNDLLASYIDIGFWGYGIWITSYFYMLYKMAKTNVIGTKTICFLFVSVVYTIINYATDNILIYINYWLPFNILILGEINNISSTQNKKE